MRQILLSLLFAALVFGQEPPLSTAPSRSQQQLEDWKARAQSSPNDTANLLRLLGVVEGPERLPYIVKFIEQAPDNPAAASKLAYSSQMDEYHAIQAAWAKALQAHPDDVRVVINAARFLEVDDKTDAESVLVKHLALHKEVAANLGLLYAKELLKKDPRADYAPHARAELHRSTNPYVLAGAGTAISNLAVGNQELIAYANSLTSRARQLAPGDKDFEGPMPLIQYLAAPIADWPASPAASKISRIHISEESSGWQIVNKPPASSSALAKQAGVQGDVKFQLIVGKQGDVLNAQLISGHPLLVQAAIEAVKSYRYNPTIVNGEPVEIVTTVTVRVE